MVASDVLPCAKNVSKGGQIAREIMKLPLQSAAVTLELYLSLENCL